MAFLTDFGRFSPFYFVFCFVFLSTTDAVLCCCMGGCVMRRRVVTGPVYASFVPSKHRAREDESDKSDSSGGDSVLRSDPQWYPEP